jgi:hypothetical protein
MYLRKCGKCEALLFSALRVETHCGGGGHHSGGRIGECGEEATCHSLFNLELLDYNCFSSSLKFARHYRLRLIRFLENGTFRSSCHEAFLSERRYVPAIYMRRLARRYRLLRLCLEVFEGYKTVQVSPE